MRILRYSNHIMIVAWLLFLLLLAFMIVPYAEAQTWNIDYAGNNSPAFPIAPACGSSHTAYFSFTIGDDLYIGNGIYSTGDGHLYRYRRSVPSWTDINPPASEKIIDCADVDGTVICVTYDGTNTDVYEYDGTNMTERVDNILNKEPFAITSFDTTCAAVAYNAIIAFHSTSDFKAYKLSTYASTTITDANWGTTTGVTGISLGEYFAFGSTGLDIALNSTCTTTPQAGTGNDAFRRGMGTDTSGCIWVGTQATDPYIAAYMSATAVSTADSSASECNTGGGALYGGVYYYTRGKNDGGSTIAKIRRRTAAICDNFNTEEAKALDTDYSETAAPIGIFIGSGGDLFVPMAAGGANSVYCYGTCTPPPAGGTQQGHVDSGDGMF